MPQYFKSAVPVRLASLHGFVAMITPDEPVLVPDICYSEAAALGCVPVAQPLPDLVESNLTPEERETELKNAISALIAKNNPKDFNIDGSPRVVVLRKLVSFEVAGDEIRAAYEALTHGV